jgi:hypothetical protein
MSLVPNSVKNAKAYSLKPFWVIKPAECIWILPYNWINSESDTPSLPLCSQQQNLHMDYCEGSRPENRLLTTGSLTFLGRYVHRHLFADIGKGSATPFPTPKNSQRRRHQWGFISASIWMTVTSMVFHGHASALIQGLRHRHGLSTTWADPAPIRLPSSSLAPACPHGSGSDCFLRY